MPGGNFTTPMLVSDPYSFVTSPLVSASSLKLSPSLARIFCANPRCQRSPKDHSIALCILSLIALEVVRLTSAAGCFILDRNTAQPISHGSLSTDR